MESYQLRQQRSVQSALVCLRQEEFQTPRICEARIDLEKWDKRIAELYSVQVENEKSEAAYNAVLRKRLRTQINSISKSGLVYLKGMPGIKDQLRLPPTKVADQKLAGAARRIIDAVRPHADVFIARKWKPDFIERADAAMAEVERIVEKPDGKVAKRSRATSDLPAAIKEARDIIGSISGLVADDLHDNPQAKEQWKHASRVPGPVGRPKYRRAHDIQKFPKSPKGEDAG